MTDQTQNQNPAAKVRVAGQELSLADVRAAMDPALRDEVLRQHPDAGTPQAAQAFVDAYAAAHEQRTGKPFTGRKA